MAIGYVPQPLEVRTGTLTKVSSNINDVEWGYFAQYGKLVIVTVKFSVASDISTNTEVLFSGLPPKISNVLFQTVVSDITNPTQDKLARINVTIEGNLTNWYTVGGIKYGQYVVNMAYFAQ